MPAMSTNNIALLWNKDGTVEAVEVRSPLPDIGPDRIYRIRQPAPFAMDHRDPWGHMVDAARYLAASPTQVVYTRLPGLCWSYKEQA